MSAPSTSGLSVELLLRVIDVKYDYFTFTFAMVRAGIGYGISLLTLGNMVTSVTVPRSDGCAGVAISIQNSLLHRSVCIGYFVHTE